MAGIAPDLAVLALLLSLGGLAVLYAAWRRSGRSPLLRGIGWGLLALSVLPWALAGGAARGVALGLVTVGVMALLLIAATGQWRGGQARRVREAKAADEPASASGWRHWAAMFLVAGPLAAAAALALSLPIMQVSAWQEANRLVGTVVSMIILWSVAAVWACATPHLLGAAAAMAGLTAAGTLLLVI